jgi:methylated-DNA-protein-cysteine methyltransferase-like protein
MEATTAQSGAGFAGRVRRVVAALRAGDVASYGEVAARAGSPGAARAVGTVLAHSDGLPWWRVVNASGRLRPGANDLQARLLARDNVAVRRGHVVGFRVRTPVRDTSPAAPSHPAGTYRGSRPNSSAADR